VAPVTIGLTLDSGAVIALVNRSAPMTKVLDAALGEGIVVTVPAVVIAECFRAPSKRVTEVLRMVTIEVLDVHLAKEAGAALAAMGVPSHRPPACRTRSPSTRSSWPPLRGAATSSTRRTPKTSGGFASTSRKCG
jgi:hypothetical protein